MEHNQILWSFASFALVLGLIGGLGVLLRYLAAKGFVLGAKTLRDRRLKIVETLPLDARRRCVILRCDDREHLLLLGGQNDIVIETNLPPVKTQNPS